MPHQLDHELERLLIGTNDQRRRAGQAFFHFYKTLIFWSDKGLGFHDCTRMWSAAGAAIFDAMAGRLQDMLPHDEDEPLRTFVRDTLDELADCMERGDHTRLSFVRWIEGRFPDLTAMMADERPDSRIFDYALAVDLAETFTFMAGADRKRMVALLRERAERLLARDAAGGRPRP